jgi:small subunit ribosomal protein S24e
MEIDITHQVDNALFARKDIKFVLKHEGEPTPSRKKMRELVAGAIGSKADAVVIDHMESATGMTATRGVARIYKSKAEALAVERKHFLDRNGIHADGGKKQEEASA